MGEQEPLISIVVPVYNKIEYLEKAIDSIKNQSFHEFECILVDDGSTDGSGLVCDDYSIKDKRFKVLHIPNGGVSHARNEGMHRAQGQFLTFMDSDDLIPSNYLECMYSNMIDSNADLVISAVTRIGKDGVRQRIRMPSNGVYSLSELLPQFALTQKESGIYGFCWGRLFSKELVKDLFFDEKIRLAEDFDFFLRVYSRVNTICFSDDTSYYYYLEQANSSVLVKDNEIDYRAQLTINVRYKHFLEEKNAYSNKNKEIVSQLISNYCFYTLFHCDLKMLKDLYKDISEVYRKEHIILKGRSGLEKWILSLVSLKQIWLVRITLICYRICKKIRKYI